VVRGGRGGARGVLARRAWCRERDGDRRVGQTHGVDGGAYTADRAAALSGVPRSTVHYWAREGVVSPSVSPERVKLWSYADLLALRTVYWLRQRKTADAGHVVPASTMPAVRRALAELAKVDVGFGAGDRPALFVTLDGEIVLQPPDEPARRLSGQIVMPGALDLIAPFTTQERTRGVDLARPAPRIRIVPRKLAGAPHVEGTRIDTEGLAALERRGFDVPRILKLYPDLDPEQVEQALAVERQLRENLAA
jgi:uncharacterized protein (DUF433 family)